MTVIALLFAFLAAEAAPAPPAAVDLASLAWLAGCWSGTGGARQVEEHWMKPAGGTMFGMGRTVSAGKTVDSEFLELRQEGSGVAYIARPARQSEASFQWVSGDASSARFENPAHEFPQVITYTLEPDGMLHARVEGTANGKVRGIDIVMRRGC